ncbi:hypothetical protein [Streptomyces caniscabiei]|uniref:hypothetical protein n=1 Tax=Streptomyces caniscabiei TaxID=2746961 RepID=UPI000A371F91|nr:hypothetical protein [Streptomyces caniscabiei]
MATRKQQQHTTSDDLLPWVIPGTALLVGILFLTAWLGGTLAAALTGAGWDPPPFTLTTLKTLVTDGPAAIWPSTSSGTGEGGGEGAAEPGGEEEDADEQGGAGDDPGQ